MKTGWHTKKLGEVCSFLNRGISPKYIDDGGVCVLNQKCIRDHRVSYEPARRHDHVAKNVSDQRFIQIGDVLVNSTGTGTLGRVAQVLEEPIEPTTVDSHVTIVRPEKDKFFTSFFGYMLQFIEEKIKESGEGCGGQTELARSVLSEKFQVSYPDSLTDQERIVSMLDEAFKSIDESINNTEKNIANAKEVFDSSVLATLKQGEKEWTSKRLSELCNIARGGSPRPIQDFLTTSSEGINWIKIGDATGGGKYIYQTAEKIIPAGASRSRMVHEGDFLLSNSMSFGHPYILKTSGCIHDGWLVLSEYSHHLNQDYLYHLLRSKLVYNQFDRLAAGSTVRNLNKELAGKVIVPVPSLIEQEAIASQFENLSAQIIKLESIYQKKLIALDELKKSILNMAFSGQLQ